MRSPRTPGRRPLVALAAVLALVVAACGGGEDEGGADGAPGGGSDSELVVTPANYELVAGRPQRLITGVQHADDGRLLGFGSVEVNLAYLGDRASQVTDPKASIEAEATFMPIPGQDVDPDVDGAARLVKPSEAIGVYGAEVTFDRPGFWGLGVTVTLDGKEHHAAAAIEVRAEPRLPAPGDPAPRTLHSTLDTAGVDLAALDSRAAVGPIDDEILHRESIVDALDAGRPLMVVVSTPVYCQSRFCGPITDSVEALAERHADRMAFVHLEVWEDFEAKKVSAAAQEWITAPGGDTNEPWVFVVDATGTVVQRFDNVATDAELDAAVRRLLS